MAKTFSTMQELGSKAPDFALPDTEGNVTRWVDVAGQNGTLVMFICNHCPYVIHIRKALATMTAEFIAQGIGVVGICANDATSYPDDSPEKMKVEKKIQGYAFPYLHDESQAVAKAYHAACTPDFFLYDASHRLVYRGQMDGSRPGNAVPNDGRDLRNAVAAILRGIQPDPKQIPSMGCNIKWKPGNEPIY